MEHKMKSWVEYGFSLWFLYLMGYVLGFAAVMSGAWVLCNLAWWVLFG